MHERYVINLTRTKILPLLEVEYVYADNNHRNGNDRLMRAVTKNSRMHTNDVNVEELDMLLLLLRDNATNLIQKETAVVNKRKKKAPKSWGFSVVRPLDPTKRGGILQCPATGCGEKASQFCSRCRVVAYCSPVCQAEHWKSHKPDCKSIKK